MIGFVVVSTVDAVVAKFNVSMFFGVGDSFEG